MGVELLYSTERMKDPHIVVFQPSIVSLYLVQFMSFKVALGYV